MQSAECAAALTSPRFACQSKEGSEDILGSGANRRRKARIFSGQGPTNKHARVVTLIQYRSATPARCCRRSRLAGYRR
eukprot:1398574-Pyramimonas_sp.AAC.1